jgi:hypothetical protein
LRRSSSLGALTIWPRRRRYAHALGLFQKRQRNVRAALERIIEKAGDVDVTASAVVAAVQAYPKINAAGEWIDRTETTSMNDLFDRMNTQELENYAQTGALPEWFQATVGVGGSLGLPCLIPQYDVEYNNQHSVPNYDLKGYQHTYGCSIRQNVPKSDGGLHNRAEVKKIPIRPHIWRLGIQRL